MRISIAIDGPAGAGKSTIAKKVAKELEIMYINSGLMYRAVTKKALEKNIAPDNIELLCSCLDNMDMYFDNDNLIVDGENITDTLNCPEINKNVASYASVPELRERLVELQRNLASKFDIIMDGRDIGTVVLKNASFKFFLTATPEERARRRHKELVEKGLDTSFEEILKDIIDRDYKDMNRKTNPLTKAEDAVEIDTTNYGIDDIVNIILSRIRKDTNNI